MIIIQSLSSSDPPSGMTSPAISSSNSTSTTSTLSVEIDDEDLTSTRSASPFEDMMDSQLTSSTVTTDPVVEDLPEALRLMRVAQRHGIKVLDFAFEGSKKEGQIEEWAWEGGAACKGFGIGFGGGAYNGPLKKYRPPPKEMPEDTEDDDNMVIDRPSTYGTTPSPPPKPAKIFSKPAPIFSGAGINVDRPLNSPGLPRQAPVTNGVSGSDFFRYLQERGVVAPPPQPMMPPEAGFKRDRSFASSEPAKEDCSPFKKRVIG